MRFHHILSAALRFDHQIGIGQSCDAIPGLRRMRAAVPLREGKADLKPGMGQYIAELLKNDSVNMQNAALFVYLSHPSRISSHLLLKETAMISPLLSTDLRFEKSLCWYSVSLYLGRAPEGTYVRLSFCASAD